MKRIVFISLVLFVAAAADHASADRESCKASCPGKRHPIACRTACEKLFAPYRSSRPAKRYRPLSTYGKNDTFGGQHERRVCNRVLMGGSNPRPKVVCRWLYDGPPKGTRVPYQASPAADPSRIGTRAIG